MTTIRSWEFWGLPRAARATVLTIIAAAVMAVVAVGTTSDETGWLLVSVLAMACAVTEVINVGIGRTESRARTDRVEITVSTDSVWVFAAVVAAPLPGVVALAVALSLLVSVRDAFSTSDRVRIPLHRVVFNISMVVLSSTGAAVVIQTYAASPLGAYQGGLLVAALAGFAVMHLAESFLLGSVVSAHGGVGWRPFRELAFDWRGALAQCALGTLIGVAGSMDPFLVAAGVPIAMLLQRGLQHRQLVTALARDPKTGVASSSGWRDRAERELALSRSSNQPMGVAVVDIDHFKTVNDTHGHLLGDEVLKATAKALTSAVRDSDLVGRFGGDEFVVLFPQAGRAAVAEAGERLRAATAELAIEAPGLELPLRITTSVGLASYPRDGDQLHSLLEQADAALYDVKHTGRGRVSFALDPRSMTAPRNEGPAAEPRRA
ncbi:diguanylate cyclase [Aquipuribacter hungaricus]|uniref:GGDEF domain-containing protein n=1 Tax=Aquipuribacter hungaricus TaxID=545624 RepID=A0ABV7WK57_9MICO